MKTLGLTGGVGMGKSATDVLIRARGIPVIDTDALARQLVEPGQPALAEIASALGPLLVDDHGRLRRAELARLIFSDPRARQRLEDILHPKIRSLWKSGLKTIELNGGKLAVVVIPLLFETHAERELDATLCIACSPATQLTRLSTRGWSAEQIQQRIAAQLPIEGKMKRSNFVFWNEASLEVLSGQLELLLGRF
jgi:dephospho-CoA kinase